MESEKKLTSKFVYAKTKAAFLDYEPNIPIGLDPIVFIKDSKEIWVKGEYFNMGSPGVIVSEKDNTITVTIGTEDFKMSPIGDNLKIQKGEGNNIIFSSTALSSINTEFPLKWDPVGKKLIHEGALGAEGSYGESFSSENASIFKIPYFTVDKWGHIKTAEETTVQIRDYVEQVATPNLQGERTVLISDGRGVDSETGIVRKAIGLTYDSEQKKLKIEGGIEAGESNIHGDLTVTGGQIIGNVKGDITGTATPKIHLSATPEYGGASKYLYGHVIVQDELGVSAPEPSSDNTEESFSEVSRGVAASPRMVWNVREQLQEEIKNLPVIETYTVNGEELSARDLGGILGIDAIGGIQAGINPVTKEITLKTVAISGYDEGSEFIPLNNRLEFTRDFEIENDRLSLRWKEIK